MENQEEEYQYRINKEELPLDREAIMALLEEKGYGTCWCGAAAIWEHGICAKHL